MHGHLRVEAFTDSNWTDPPLDKRSITGYCTFLGNLVTWKSKKQTMVGRSTAEAEYKAITHISCELMWIKLKFKVTLPMDMYRDSQAAIRIASNPFP